MVLTAVPLMTALLSMSKSGQRAAIGKEKTMKEQRTAFSKETIVPLILRCPYLSAFHAVSQIYKVPMFYNSSKNHKNEDKKKPNFYPGIKSPCTSK